MNNIFNILLHIDKGMTIGMHLTANDFKKVVRELPPQYKKRLLRIYLKHAKVLGPHTRRFLHQNK
jgi:hypothetical protein